MAREGSLSLSFYSMPTGSMPPRALRCFWVQARNSVRVGRCDDRDGGHRLYSTSTGSVAMRAFSCFWAQDRKSSRLDRLRWRVTWSSCWWFTKRRERETSVGGKLIRCQWDPLGGAFCTRGLEAQWDPWLSACEITFASLTSVCSYWRSCVQTLRMIL